MITKNSKQCRERWCNHLNPGLKQGEWTVGEDKVILMTQALYGNQWATISKLLPGRTDSSIKNRFLVLQRHMSKVDDSSAMSSAGIPKRVSKSKDIDNDNDNYSQIKSERNSFSSSLSTDISNEYS